MPHRAVLAWGAAIGRAGCQGTCWDKTCFFQTNLLQAPPVLPGEQLSGSSLPSTKSPTQPWSSGANTKPPAPWQHRESSWAPPRPAHELQPFSLSSCCRWAELSQNRSVQAGLGSAARRRVARHSMAQCRAGPILLAPRTLIQLSGSQICGATTTMASSHGSTWQGHVHAEEPQHAECSQLPMLAARGSLDQTTAPSQAAQHEPAAQQQLDLATLCWQHCQPRHRQAAPVCATAQCRTMELGPAAASAEPEPPVECARQLPFHAN